MCSRLRTALDATSVAVWSGDPPAVIAASGPAPKPGGDGVEVVPVPYGADVAAHLAWTARERPLSASQLVFVDAAAEILGPLVAAVPSPVLPPPPALFGLVGNSEAMVAIRGFIPKAAASHLPVLVEGESGVGKELVARAIHAASPRRQGAFVAVNCAALADELIDAELFGHARGAFTGAALERRGLIEEAHAGTLFLDEVSELAPRAQAKLLRVLQEGEVRRVGENAPRRVDLRVVAATNRPLEREAAAGRFRHDLRFRLDVIRVRVPPLRERRCDIPDLAEHFWSPVATRMQSRARLAPSLLAALSAREWPGNARELQNAVSAIAVSAPTRGIVRADDVGLTWSASPAVEGTLTLEDARRAFETSFVRGVVARYGPRPSAVARELGVTRQGLAKLMRRLGIPTAAMAPAVDDAE